MKKNRMVLSIFIGKLHIIKPRLAFAVLLLVCLVIPVFAQEILPHNTWVTLVSDGQKSTLAGNSFQGSDYFAWVPVVVQPGAQYTLIAEWDDGKAMLVIFQGHDPRAAAPSLPSGASKMATINSSGGKSWRMNFSVDERSTGNAGYLVFAAGGPGRKVRVMLKDPGDTDEQTKAEVNGKYIGTVFSTPVYATGKIEATAPVVVDGLPLNEWVSFPSSATASRLASLESDGEKYYAVAPVRMEKGGRYTLFAEWDDGKAMLLFVRGYDPTGKAPSAPSGTYAQVTINTSGGKAWRINFTVDPKSAGNTAWLVFQAAAPGRALRIMVKSPGDPDEVTTAVVKGSYVGSVYQTPLHLFGQ